MRVNRGNLIYKDATMTDYEASLIDEIAELTPEQWDALREYIHPRPPAPPSRTSLHRQRLRRTHPHTSANPVYRDPQKGAGWTPPSLKHNESR